MLFLPDALDMWLGPGDPSIIGLGCIAFIGDAGIKLLGPLCACDGDAITPPVGDVRLYWFCATWYENIEMTRRFKKVMWVQKFNNVSQLYKYK